jgi:hypothetical protein
MSKGTTDNIFLTLKRTRGAVLPNVFQNGLNTFEEAISSEGPEPEPCQTRP